MRRALGASRRRCRARIVRARDPRHRNDQAARPVPLGSASLRPTQHLSCCDHDDAAHLGVVKVRQLPHRVEEGVPLALARGSGQHQGAIGKRPPAGALAGVDIGRFAEVTCNEHAPLTGLQRKLLGRGGQHLEGHLCRVVQGNSLEPSPGCAIAIHTLSLGSAVRVRGPRSLCTHLRTPFRRTFCIWLVRYCR